MWPSPKICHNLPLKFLPPRSKLNKNQPLIRLNKGRKIFLLTPAIISFLEDYFIEKTAENMTKCGPFYLLATFSVEAKVTCVNCWPSLAIIEYACSQICVLGPSRWMEGLVEFASISIFMERKVCLDFRFCDTHFWGIRELDLKWRSLYNWGGVFQDKFTAFVKSSSKSTSHGKL